MSKPILTVRGATRHYNADTPALQGADLDLFGGTITALLGPSGSGKSTLLRAIAGLEQLDAGQIICGTQYWNGNGPTLPPEKRRVGMVFQDYALFPHLNALANVAFGLSGSDKKRRALAQLEAAELGHKANAYPHELSGGEQQRVALARALAPSPAIVLLDEPFSGLDRRLRSDLRARTIASLKTAGATALIVTHDAEEAMAVADQLALMGQGRIIQTGTPDEVWLNPASAASARLLGDVDVCTGKVADGLVSTPLGELPAPDHKSGQSVDVLVRPAAISVIPAADGAYAIAECRSTGAELAMTLKAADGSMWRARVPAPCDLKTGDRVNIKLNQTFVTVTDAAG